jgi:hypothetical protein
MKKSLQPLKILIKSTFLVLLLSNFSSFAQTWPCNEYLVRQTVNPGTINATTELGVTSAGKIPTVNAAITPVCTYNAPYNGLAYYNGKLFVWKQYGASTVQVAMQL